MRLLSTVGALLSIVAVAQSWSLTRYALGGCIPTGPQASCTQNGDRPICCHITFRSVSTRLSGSNYNDWTAYAFEGRNCGGLGEAKKIWSDTLCHEWGSDEYAAIGIAPADFNIGSIAARDGNDTIDWVHVYD